MAATWGRAEIEVHVDGHTLPREVRDLALTAGKEGGDAGGKAFNKSFGERVRDGFRDTFAKFKGFFSGIWARLFRKGGETVGDGFADGFKDSMKTFKLEFDKVSTDVVRRSSEMARTARDVDFGRWADDFGEFRRVFGELGNGFDGQLAIGPGVLEDLGELVQVFENIDTAGHNAASGTDAFNSATDTTEGKMRKVRRSANLLNKAFSAVGSTIRGLSGGKGGGGGIFKNLWDRLDEGNGHVNGHTSAWKNLSANTRQWTLIIGAVIGAIPELAGLGSAVGSGLFVLAGGLGAAGAAAALAIVPFMTFMGDIKKVPAKLKPARKAFDDMKSSIRKVFDEMTVKTFQGTEGAWKHFGEVVKGLQPGLDTIGTVVHNLIIDLSKNLTPDVVKDLNGFLETGADTLDRLVRAAGTLGKALIHAFNDPAFIQALDGFLDWIDTIIGRFATFLAGPGFDEWLRHGEEVFGAFGKLLDTTGTLLNDLVTDESIGQLVDFIDNIDGFLQGGGKDILEFAQKLDIFGIIAQALNDFGEALSPLAGPMKDLAEAINDVLSTAIDTLAPILTDIAKALGPLVKSIADFMKQNPQAVANGILLIVAAFTAWKAIKMAKLAIDFLAFSTSMEKGGKAVKKFDAAKLRRISGGLAGIAALSATQLLPDDFWDQFGIESNLPDTTLTGAAFGSMFGIWGTIIGGGIGLVISLFTNFQASMNDLGPQFATLLTVGPWAAFPVSVASFFASLVPPEWETSDNPLQRALFHISEIFTKFGDTMAKSVDAWKTVVLPAWDGFWNKDLPTTVNTWGSDLDTNTTTWFDSVWTNFTTFMDTAAPGWNDFWGGLPDAVDKWGGDVQTNAETGWANVSAAFETGKTTVGNAWNDFWGKLPDRVNKWGSDVETNVKTAWHNVQSWFTTQGQTVQDNWNRFWGGLPGAVTKFGADIERNVRNLAGFFERGFQSVWTTVTTWVNRIAEKIRVGLSQLPLVGGLFGGNQGGNSGGGGAAAGRLVFGGQRILVGEAGPEAIVPLKRSLSRVDPSVRALSAIAQGISPMAGGGVVSGGRSVNIAEGAVQVFDAGNSRQTAYDVLDVLANRIAG